MGADVGTAGVAALAAETLASWSPPSPSNAAWMSGANAASNACLSEALFVSFPSSARVRVHVSVHWLASVVSVGR